MAKLRKMLGDVNSEDCKALMALIGTQSKRTLENWAIGYGVEKCLPIYAKCCPDDAALHAVVDKCRAYLAGDMLLKEIKPVLAEGRKLSAAVKGEPAQASARAVATACAVINTPTNAFGFLLYLSAAVAYAELGLEKSILEYEAVAAREMAAALKSLKAVAVENEPHPVKVDWNC